jgi:quercetin dioxygenase-like cupin family protein
MSCQSCELCIEQPPLWEHTSVDGVFIKQMFLAAAGTLVPQHSHVYDHTTMLAVGSVRVWIEGELQGDFHAPRPLFIKAKAKHTFQSLEPNTLLYCIHRSRGGPIAIHAEHQLK